MKALPIGTLITYELSDGQHTAKIINEDEKNDMRVYDLDDGHWCYEHQVIRILNNP